MSLTPSDEEIQIRDAVRRITESFGPEYMRKCQAAEQAPTELWATLADAGFIGINLPSQYGGGDMGLTGLQIVAEETAAAGALMVMLVMSSGIAGPILAKHGTPEQKELWLTAMAAGTKKMSFAITEPDAGSNSHDLRSELTPDGEGGYFLRGQKTFISGVDDADAVLVVARPRTSDGTLGRPCLCIIDVHSAGFTKTHIPMPAFSPDRQWTLYFDDVRVPADCLIGGTEGGLAAVFDGLNPERVLIAAFANGIGRRALTKATTYATERQVWNAPIGSHQAVAHPLARAKIELELARLMTQKAARLVDAGHTDSGEASNMAKFAAAEAAIHCVDATIQTHGGNGFALEYGISDMYWPARLFRTAPVSAEMILNYIAQHSLGLPRSY
ncbi:acyl-CoA dehydrogenase [Rhodococcus sp. KBW08]|uniref:acyl-CoA dehydrogenase family protein n=1 Tax=Rhodococcus sp. KBW08 TaxID=2144188 RepID=UPI000F5A00D5|nr:acyl-CoA dehydrogenase family protein [Rhodococcus sp. KBW08]RQO50380.1 acyl-CoA dehydrogenase [Rhodococcus sp. KBW08]